MCLKPVKKKKVRSDGTTSIISVFSEQKKNSKSGQATPSPAGCPRPSTAHGTSKRKKKEEKKISFTSSNYYENLVFLSQL